MVLSMPSCYGEQVETALDLSAGDQRYIEGGSVCCRLVVFELRTGGVDWSLDVCREDD